MEINLDARELMREVLVEMRAWICNLASGHEPVEVIPRIDKNLYTLANVPSRGEESVKGFVI